MRRGEKLGDAGDFTFEIVRTWSDSSNVCVAESSGSIARVRRATRDANEKDSKRRRVRRVDAHARRAKNDVIGNRCRLPRRLLLAVYRPPTPSILVACSSIDNNGGRVPDLPIHRSARSTHPGEKFADRRRPRLASATPRGLCRVRRPRLSVIRASFPLVFPRTNAQRPHRPTCKIFTFGATLRGQAGSSPIGCV